MLFSYCSVPQFLLQEEAVLMIQSSENEPLREKQKELDLFNKKKFKESAIRLHKFL